MTSNSLLSLLRSPRVVMAAKLLVFVIVAFFIGRAVVKAFDQMQAEGVTLASLNLWWLCLAGGLFLVAQIPLAWFWRQAMWQLGQHPSWSRTLYAYYLGSLGKYVPGKAMVVVLRTGFVRGPQVDPIIAALCVFIETLTMMAAGGFLGAVLVLVLVRFTGLPIGETWLVYPLAIGLMLATGIPTIPPIFRFVAKVLRISRAKADVNELLERLDYRLMAQGWLANLVAWPIMGLSLWSALKAMPETEHALGSPWQQLPLLTASIALAVVAGFVSMLPGGVGVRELVLNLLMTPTFGRLAIVSIILLRLAWLMAEVAFSSILYVSGKLMPQAPTPESEGSADST